MSMLDKAYSHELFNRVIDDLIINQFFSRPPIRRKSIAVTSEQLRKCIWICSILASSDNDEHRKKAQLFSALAYLQRPNDQLVESACYLLMSRTGNLTAARLFQNFPDRFDQSNTYRGFDAVLGIELANEWNNKLIVLGNEQFVSSTFQKGLWDKLNAGKGISISAPTSAGKSFVIKKYIKKKLTEKSNFSVLYIVPSRALINQVSEEFRIDLVGLDVEIRTTFIEEDNVAGKRIYILTAERCLRLIQNAVENKIVMNLIFVDEIQNLEDEEGRGSLLEYVIKELGTLFGRAQIIFAGPNISNSKELYSGVLNRKSDFVQTTVSPVFQIRVIVRVVNNESLHLTLKGCNNNSHAINLKTGNLKRKFDMGSGGGLAEIVKLFGVNQQNIIYSPRTDYVVNWALKYTAQAGGKSPTKNKEILELIEFLEDEIHPMYSLISCLEREVAFHHSKLPDIVRKELEDLFLDGKVRNLFCTSTLLEGVNLPANNLFVISPRKLSDELSPFEFGNLIGRAGRIKDSLYGTIFCIEKNKSDNWAESFYEKSFQKDVLTATDKALEQHESFIESLKSKSLDINKTRYLTTVILIRHKYIRDKNELRLYLTRKKMSNSVINTIFTSLKKTLNGVDIPIDLLKLNPSIDPILQDALYQQIKHDGVLKWVITFNSNFYNRITSQKNDSLEFEDTSFFWQLVSIMDRLDKTFQINREMYFKHQVKMTIKQVCLYGIQWLNNVSYRDLILRDINFHAKHFNVSKRIDPTNRIDVNRRINEVIKINSTVVSYILVKYIKLLNDMVSFLMNEQQREEYKFSLALPIMLELGTSESTIIQLISKGVSRTVALKVFNEFKKNHNYKDLDIFEWLKSKTKLPLKPIYNRYLKKIRLLSD